MGSLLFISFTYKTDRSVAIVSVAGGCATVGSDSRLAAPRLPGRCVCVKKLHSVFLHTWACCGGGGGPVSGFGSGVARLSVVGMVVADRPHIQCSARTHARNYVHSP